MDRTKLIRLFYRIRDIISFLLYLGALYLAISDSISPKVVYIIIGYIILIVAATWRIWGTLYVGDALVSHQPKAEHIITEGPYSYVRHPIYFATLIGGIGIPIVFNSVILIFTYTVPLFLYYIFLARYEEKILVEKFNEEYIRYKKCVPMLFPVKRRYSSKSQVSKKHLNIRALWKEYGALAFIVTIFIALWDGGIIR